MRCVFFSAVACNGVGKCKQQDIALSMDCSQDSAFCVPVYGDAESANAGQAQDHSNSKQDQGLYHEVVPVFNPSWRDKPHVGVERKDDTAKSGCVPLDSSQSAKHVDDRRPANDHFGTDVS